MLEFLKPGCKNLRKKVLFFALNEGWLLSGLDREQEKVLKEGYSRIQRQYKMYYYHTLFHLLTCHFCIDQENELLLPRSHPDLWQITLKNPGYFWHIIQEARIKGKEDEKLHYFQILYENLLENSPQNIVLAIYTKNNLLEKILPVRRAAGISDSVPSDICISDFFLFQEENISLHWERDSCDSSLCIGLQGGTPQLRSSILFKVCYSNGEEEQWKGEEICMGGMWKIGMQKADKICRIELLCQDISV